jgi:alanyl-tRNA synthetase
LTGRLYFDDPLLARFDAAVVGHGRFQGWPSVILDRTALYPEAGGQMADRGSLRFGETAAPVTDVQVDDAGVVHHRLGIDATGYPAVGATIAGEVDMRRRRVHMALHTGQHMLSRALLDEANAATVSARLGETACTIDLEVATLDEAAAVRAEALVNDVIDADRAIRAFFPTASELASLELRRAPKVDRDVRVVAIEDFDVSPCGGTHCTRTSQVALCKITGVERYKGKMRVTFVAGARARHELGRARDDLSALARDMTCGPSDVAGAVGKLRTELAAARDVSKRHAVELASRIAAELASGALARGETTVVAMLPFGETEPMRAVAGAVTAKTGGAVVLAGPVADGLAVMVSRGGESTLDCGKTLKAIAAAAGGRGGGRAEHAEGRLPSGVDFAAVVSNVLGSAAA